jgi:hypothetical protein
VDSSKTSFCSLGPILAADDHHLLASIAWHLGGFLQEFQLRVGAVGDGAGLVPGFESRVAHVDEIRTHGAGRAVLFNDAGLQQADAFGLVERFDKIRRLCVPYSIRRAEAGSIRTAR